MMTIDAFAVHLLWTGGWDSTFRLLDLTINQGRVAQPHYIINIKRPSFALELHTQAKIRQLTYESFPATRHLILPTRIYSGAELGTDVDLEARFLALQFKYTIGSQYDWIAKFAQTFGEPPLELSLTREGKIRNLLAPSVVPLTHAGLATYRLNDTPHDEDLELFRHFTFPLFELTKPEMGARARCAGFEHILHATWFCFTPIRQQIPCGKCAACLQLMECGYTERMHTLSHLQYWLYRHTRWLPDPRTELKKYPLLHRTLKRLLRPNEFEPGKVT